MNVKTPFLYKKKLKSLIIVLLVIVVLVMFSYNFFLKRYIPVTITDFKSYKSFRNMTVDFFPDNLPDSSQNVKYYYYRGHFDYLWILSFELNDSKERDDLLNKYKEWFNRYDRNNCKENIELSEKIIKEEKIEYINDYIESIDDSRMLYYAKHEGEFDTKRGVITDNMDKFVLFYKYDSKEGVH